MARVKAYPPKFHEPPPPSAGPFGSNTPMPGAGAPVPGGNHDMPGGVMKLPYDHPLEGWQSYIHRKLPAGHPLKPLQKMLRPLSYRRAIRCGRCARSCSDG